MTKAKALTYQAGQELGVDVQIPLSEFLYK